MRKLLKILMIDDHALILEGYKGKLKEWADKNKVRVIIDTAHDSDEAKEKIDKAGVDGYNVVFLDISIPPSKDRKILSGEDLGLQIRKYSQKTSLIVLTMHSDSLRLMNILKNLNPDSFLIKSDVTPQEFLKAVVKVLQGEVHYSQTIIELLRKQMTTEVVLDELDRNILFYLSEGVRTKDLVNKVPASLASIEKRKKIMKEIFEVEKGGDLALVKKAKQAGFL